MEDGLAVEHDELRTFAARLRCLFDGTRTCFAQPCGQITQCFGRERSASGKCPQWFDE